MPELFMKYPIHTCIAYQGRQYMILGYEMYNGRRYLICRNHREEMKIEV